MPAAQHEPEETPVAESIPAVGQGVPRVESGVGGLEIRTSGGGLRPPTPSSVEPSGMPTRPTCDPNPIPVGDEADDDGPAVGLLAVVVQVPDAFPVVPPPSKIVLEPELPVADIPELKEVPGIELAMPEAACGIDPPILEQLVMLPGAGPNGDAPNVNGLTPGDESSVAPMGMPARGTAGAGPMPSGDVIPNGDPRGDVPIPPTCAAAEPLAKTAAVSVANDQCVNLRRRVIVMCSELTDVVPIGIYLHATRHGRARCRGASPEAAVIGGRRLPRRFAECGSERTGFAESDRQSDFGHRELRLRQKCLRLLDAPAVVISVRRHAE